MTTFEVRTIRSFNEPECMFTAPAGKLLYRGEDEAAACKAKAAFDTDCDVCEGAVVTRLSDGMQLRDDVGEWQAAA